MKSPNFITVATLPVVSSSAAYTAPSDPKAPEHSHDMPMSNKADQLQMKKDLAVAAKKSEEHGVEKHSPGIRMRLAWLRVALETETNAAGATGIRATDSKIRGLVYSTDEKAVIALYTQVVPLRYLSAVHV